MTTESLPLAAEFPTTTHDEWVEVAEKTLKGKPLDKLRSRTADGIEIVPVYAAPTHPAPPRSAPGSAPYVRGSSASGAVATGWEIRQRHGGSDAAAANAAILQDLRGGVTALWLDVNDAAALPMMLAGVLADIAPIVLAPNPNSLDMARALLAFWEGAEVPNSAARGGLGLDPHGVQARYGRPLDLEAAIGLAAQVAGTHPQVRPITVDATPYADAGASEGWELAAALATGVAYLRSLTEAGLSIDAAAGALEFTFTASADQFLTMAKFRAARQVWSRVLEASGAEPAGQHQHAVTAAGMFSQRDPWVNMLRATTACFAAATGGAAAVTVLPFDSAIGEPDDLGRRVARNTQLILTEESHLNGVIDPAGGSWYVEDLTSQLAAVAWERFQQIEAAGGIAAALESGMLSAVIDETWAARSARIAKRSEPLTGVSEFPDIEETPVTRSAGTSEPADGLPLRRLAAGYEALRDAADAAATVPTIFLANLGPIAVHTARASYAKNFFEAGGVRTLSNDGFADAQSAAAAFGASGAAVAVLCSSDAVYGDLAAETAAALKGAGATSVYLAGHPGDARADYEAAGIDGFIHMGCDVLATLIELHEELGL